MKSGLTNSGKKEQRQISQVLTKSVNEDGTEAKRSRPARRPSSIA